uniref:Uncharacterized protein n=1 Tax=Anguilla anguilla TaxID=7936 RepID=A0A0E9S9E0_ANGAN
MFFFQSGWRSIQNKYFVLLPTKTSTLRHNVYWKLI